MNWLSKVGMVVGALLVALTFLLIKRNVQLAASLEQARTEVRLLGLERQATDQVLARYLHGKEEIADAKAKYDASIADTVCFTGDDRIDALLRVLEDSAQSACHKATAGSAGAVPGAR